MADRQSNKGNPASHRMGNAHHKSHRAKCWLSGHARKRARIAAQAEREAANKVRRANGEPTPWEVAKTARRERRAE